MATEGNAANAPTPGPTPTPSESITATPPAPAPAATSESVTATPPAPAPALPPAAPPTSAAPPPPAGPPAWLLKADFAILALLLILTFMLGSFAANNSDLYMHLAVGQRLSDGKLTFGEDPFSWVTQANAETKEPAVYWVNHSWLYSWLFFQLHELIGGAGLVALKALLITISVGLLSRIGWNDSSRWFVLLALIMAALAVSIRLHLQPIVVSFLFLSITLYVLNRVGFFGYARADGKAPCPRVLWVLPPLFALWANLDAWFILGPIVVGLCWAAAGLTRWFPYTKVVPAKTLGLVFGVGLLACLLNPHHVRVFQLPPELGYLLATVTDALHLRLPNEIVGAGRTLVELKKDESATSWTMSVVSGKYWKDSWQSIAVVAFVPLIVLGLLAFVVTARVKPQEGMGPDVQAPAFHVGRFLLWLVFGVMALALARMVPFFALVAAPLTALTLGEFLRWQQIVSNVPAEKRDRGLMVARLVTFPFMLLLIYLAWPGWLQGQNDYTSPRRVAWDIRPDPSLKRAAETLAGLKQEGGSENVFNVGYDLPNYLAWFAPEVKFGIDTRFALYADRIHDYRAALKALDADERHGWQDYFVEHKVNQVALANFMRNESKLPFYWLEVDQWRQRGGDMRSVIFSWSGPERRWPADENDRWNAEAFGKVPKDRRPPAEDAPTPTAPGIYSMYLDGIGPEPLGASEFLLLKRRFVIFGKVQNDPVHRASMVWMLGSLTSVQGLPGGGMNMGPTFVTTFLPWAMLAPRDYGPPALPVLMIRSTRQAVAENPYDAHSRSCLLDAIETTRRFQEEQWSGTQGALRGSVRHTQMVTCMYALSQLKPESYDLQVELAKICLQEKMFDLALEHMKLAEKAMEDAHPSSSERKKELEARLKAHREDMQGLEKEVRSRTAKWKEEAAARKYTPFQKALLAYKGSYQEVRGKGPVGINFALGKTAGDILVELNPESLNEEERFGRFQVLCEISLASGRADEVMKSLQVDNIKKGLPPEIYALNQLHAGAALGDYQAVDEALATYEKFNVKRMAEETERRASIGIGANAPALLVMPQIGSASALACAAALQANRPLLQIEAIKSEVLPVPQGELGNVLTLRGIFALEAGNTAHARALFQRAIDEAGESHSFTDRPIARRYLELLNEQKR